MTVCRLLLCDGRGWQLLMVSYVQTVCILAGVNGDRAGCHAVPCVQLAENTRESRAAKYIRAGQGHVGGYL
jgi:hypothetical protein